MIKFLAEQLSLLGTISYKRMFGADCLFLNGQMIGIVKGDDIFIKKSHINADDTRFGYQRQGKTVYLNYVLIDNLLLDEQDELIGLVNIFFEKMRDLV